MWFMYACMELCRMAYGFFARRRQQPRKTVFGSNFSCSFSTFLWNVIQFCRLHAVDIFLFHLTKQEQKSATHIYHTASNVLSSTEKYNNLICAMKTERWMCGIRICDAICRSSLPPKELATKVKPIIFYFFFLFFFFLNKIIDYEGIPTMASSEPAFAMRYTEIRTYDMKGMRKRIECARNNVNGPPPPLLAAHIHIVPTIHVILTYTLHSFATSKCSHIKIYDFKRFELLLLFFRIQNMCVLYDPLNFMGMCARGMCMCSVRGIGKRIFFFIYFREKKNRLLLFIFIGGCLLPTVQEWDTSHVVQSLTECVIHFDFVLIHLCRINRSYHKIFFAKLICSHFLWIFSTKVSPLSTIQLARETIPFY